MNRSHLAAPYVEGLGSLRAQLVERLRKSVSAWKKPPGVLFLFGSVASGEAGAESDLDLLVIRRLDTNEESPRWQQQLTDLENDATVWTGNEARMIEYGKADLAESAVREVAEEALEDGIAIYGTRLQLRRLLKRYEA